MYLYFSKISSGSYIFLSSIPELVIHHSLSFFVLVGDDISPSLLTSPSVKIFSITSRTPIPSIVFGIYKLHLLQLSILLILSNSHSQLY